MKNYIFLLCLCLFIQNTQAQSIAGSVVGVSDGDTITLLTDDSTKYKIRLMGIDAPEKKQAFGTASKISLSNLIYSKRVVAEGSKVDKYGRLIAKILLNGTDINLKQIEQGMAWFYFKYQNELNQDDRIRYIQAHEYSANNKIGLWADTSPVAPWDLRKHPKQN